MTVARWRPRGAAVAGAAVLADQVSESGRAGRGYFLVGVGDRARDADRHRDGQRLRSRPARDHRWQMAQREGDEALRSYRKNLTACLSRLGSDPNRDSVRRLGLVTVAAGPRFDLDDSFARDLVGLHEPWEPVPVADPSLLVLNESLAAELGLDVDALRSHDGVAVLAGNAVPEGVTTVAQAYAGHQFGGYSPRLGDGRALLLGEFGAYASFTGIENWPVTAWVDFATNFSAESSDVFDTGSDGTAWNAGVVVGDRTKYLEIGFDYLYVEANAFPSQLIESDWIDGKSNREAYVFWLTRRLFANTDLQTLVSFGDAIDDSLPAYENSVGKADRVRFQTDLTISF